MRDEALKIALDALKLAASELYRASSYIELARALDKKAENARELGLDYEPVGLIDRLTNPEQHYEFTDPKKANAVLMSLCQEAADALAAPVQPMAHIVGEIDHTGKVWKPVQPAPVQERTDYEVHLNHCNIGECEGVCKYLDDDCPALEHADMKAKWDRPTPPAAQPAVPDALTSADIQEHIEYVAGWNDCRAEMLKGMKP